MELYLADTSDMYDLCMLVILLRIRTVRGHGCYTYGIRLWRSFDSDNCRLDDNKYS